VKTLAARHNWEEILDRLNTVMEADRPIWGRMTAHQMLCHLADSYSLALGERTALPAITFFQRTLVKWAALRSPFPWPHGVPTRPEMEQGVGGTSPIDFQSDHAKLVGIIHHFVEHSSLSSHPHPMFGHMSNADWLRWGYLHADHHLRQFRR
jgi:hypothetical protein